MTVDDGMFGFYVFFAFGFPIHFYFSFVRHDLRQSTEEGGAPGASKQARQRHKIVEWRVSFHSGGCGDAFRGSHHHHDVSI